MEEGKHLAHKGRFWLGLSVGLFLGIAIAITFYFIDKYAFIESLRHQNATTESSSDTIVQIVEKNNYFHGGDSKEKSSSSEKELSTADSSDLMDFTDENVADAQEFQMDEEENDVPHSAIKAKWIANRRLKVQNVGEGYNVRPEYDYFEVEQWSEPVKNRYSYQRNGSLLKIKGFEIQNIVISWDGTRFAIEYKGHSYPIPENKEFTRLSD